MHENFTCYEKSAKESSIAIDSKFHMQCSIFLCEDVPPAVTKFEGHSGEFSLITQILKMYHDDSDFNH